MASNGELVVRINLEIRVVRQGFSLSFALSTAKLAGNNPQGSTVRPIPFGH
jgi:hypothetical protein